MLFELPLTTAEEIVAEFRPDGRTATKGALRTLRARRAVSGGISEPVREPSGQVRGSLHLYCALNLDAARLARLGRDAEAQQIAAVAEDIERRDETAHVALALAEARAEVDDHWSPRRVFSWALDQDPTVSVAVQAIATATADARRTLADEFASGEERLFGYVLKIHGELAEIGVLDTGESLSVLADDLREQDSLFVGAPLALRWEHWGHGRTLFTTEPALDMDSPTDVEHAAYPFERPLPSRDTRVRLAQAVTAGPATVRRPRRIPIAE